MEIISVVYKILDIEVKKYKAFMSETQRLPQEGIPMKYHHYPLSNQNQEEILLAIVRRKEKGSGNREDWFLRGYPQYLSMRMRFYLFVYKKSLRWK